MLASNKRARLFSLITICANMSSFAESMVMSLSNAKVVSTLDGIADPNACIGTHDGSFHCDEALAISMLKLLPRYSQATVVRSRNNDLLTQCGIVVDVGAIYDATTNRYDHHQREFTGVLEGYNTKLSSAGLVYKHFGHDIIREVLKSTINPSLSTNDEFVEIVFHKLYVNFMEHIDAIDNGISIADGAPLKYHISTTLSGRVGNLNPAWNVEQSKDIYNAQFIKAMCLTGSEFVGAVEGLANNWWPARSIVIDAMKARKQIHPSGKILVFEMACPWKDHLFELDDEGSPPLYVLYADSGGSWRIQAVPMDPNSFTSRKKLPTEWCGLRDDVLSAKTGVPGGIFIHTGGFIGGHKDKAGALEMAIKALDLE